jgi:2'-5' RNA ligase
MHADTLHMTLQFVGVIEPARLPQLTQAADRVLVPSFDLTLERLSFWSHNHIVYAAPNAEVPALYQLVTALQQELTAEGFLFAGGKFNPHVTLLRHVEHAIEPQNITPIMWWADAFVLVESVVTNQRAHYRVLQKWPLLPRATQKL